MSDTLVNTLAVPGHNQPPEPTPYERAQKRIDDLTEEAALWLDGAAIDSQELADGIANLMRTLEAARKEADASRKVEAKPFDDGKAEIQARYNPLLAKADTAISACKAAQKPWLQKLVDDQNKVAEEARRLAEEKAEGARKALRVSDAANLAERNAAEDLVTDAQRATREAVKAEKATAHNKGATGRAVHLRSFWAPSLADLREACRHYYVVEPDKFAAFVQSLAEADVARGIRSIPGFVITEDKRVA